MNNAKVKEMIKFSFYKNIQNKWFILFNIISLISIVILLNWNSIGNLFRTETKNEPFKLAILDNSNLIYDNLMNELTNNATFEIERINENTYTAENIPDDFAIIEIIPDEAEAFKTSIISKEGISNTIYVQITDVLYQLRNHLFSQKYNINAEELAILQSNLSINRVMLGVEAENSNSKEAIKLFSSALTYLITIMIFSKMANEIAQEKQSKSSEYILTTVSSKEYLFAKIFSNIAILLIQGLLLLVYYFIAVGIMSIINIATTDLTLSTGFMAKEFSLDTVFYILALLIYNILNLILLCIIQATLSAKTASTSEAGNTVSLLAFIMMITYITTVYLITPYTKVSTALYVISCLPVLSAYFVPAMMVIGQATILQILLSLTILLITIPLTFNACSKIFKNGILDYTKVKKKKNPDKDSRINDFLIKRKMKNIGFVVGIAILIYIGSQTILSLLGNFLLPTLLGNILTETDITLILQILIQILSLGLSSAFVLAYCNHDKEKTTNFSQITAKTTVTTPQKVKIVFMTLFIIFVLQILLSILIYPKIGLNYDVTDMFDINAESSILSKIILIVAMAIIPGIFEELFFRKAIIDFTAPYGKNFALLFSALLFGIIHMNLSQGLFAFIIGILFGIIYLYTNDIKLTMFIHFLNNGYAALAMILPENTIFLITLILLVFLMIGFVFLVLTFTNENSRNRIRTRLHASLSLKTVGTKYKYIFYDYIFDISILLIFIMSLLTENLLR